MSQTGLMCTCGKTQGTHTGYQSWYCQLHQNGAGSIQSYPFQPKSVVTYSFGKVEKGWECPKCEAVMGPTIPCCVNCQGKKKNDSQNSHNL